MTPEQAITIIDDALIAKRDADTETDEGDAAWTAAHQQIIAARAQVPGLLRIVEERIAPLSDQMDTFPRNADGVVDDSDPESEAGRVSLALWQLYRVQNALKGLALDRADAEAALYEGRL